MTLTKSDLTGKLAERGFTRKKAAVFVDRVLEIVKSTLAKGEDLLISGFGKFEVRDKGPRKGRNPATGNGIELEARRVVVFRPSPRLREKINGDGGKGGGRQAVEQIVPEVVYVCDVCGERHCICRKER
ncbi:Integration host factor subunit alpha (modular protein) [uncultured Desulfatiglans sp.]|nr:Integration host factor subunit alpha (modular protein) [uncultured Desulfatiglans sp.]